MKRIWFLIPALLGLVALIFLPNFSISTTVSPAKVSAEIPEFQAFLQQFPLKSLPYEITANELTQRLNNIAGGKKTAPSKHLQYSGEEVFLPYDPEASFSRSPTFTNPVARMETQQYHAVVYCKSTGFSRGFSTYYLAVFDKSGKRISNNWAASLGTSEITTLTVLPDLQAITVQHIVNWKNDIDNQGIQGNKVIGLTQTETKNMDLTQPTEDPVPRERFKPTEPLPIENPAPTTSKAK